MIAAAPTLSELGALAFVLGGFVLILAAAAAIGWELGQALIDRFREGDE